MPIETGFELVDAIINNPMQAVILFALGYVLFKFLFACNGFWADIRNDIKFELKYNLQRPLERKLDNSLEWLERRDQSYIKWRKETSEEKMLGLKLPLISIPFLPLLIWYSIVPSDVHLLLQIVLLIQYLFFISIMLCDYKLNRRKLEKLKN